MDERAAGSGRLATRVFRGLTALYPAAFRDEYGREMSLVFADRYRHARGRWRRAALCVEAAAGIVWYASREHLTTIARDVREALRQFRSRPGYSIAVVVMLAVALAATTTMFAVVDTVLVRPLPYRDPSQLVLVSLDRPGQTGGARVGYADVETWQGAAASFAGIAAFDPVSITFSHGGESAQIGGSRITPNLPAVLGTSLARGRWFTNEDAERQRRVAIVSDGLWLSRFARSAAAIGSVVAIDGLPFEIVGILPHDSPMGGADVLVPHSLAPDWNRQKSVRGPGPWFVVGRLRAGTSPERARAELTAIAQTSDDGVAGAEGGYEARIEPFAWFGTTPGERATLWWLLAAAGCVLLVAVSNVSGLTLARGLARAPELATRLSLGAGRTDLVRRLVAESVTLSLVAGSVGLLLSSAALAVIRTIGLGVPRLAQVSLDVRVFAVALAMAVCAGIVAGLVPAFTVTRRSLLTSAAAGGRGGSGAASARTVRRWLVVSQCAAAVVLLVGAGLLVRSWWQIAGVDPGFDRDGVAMIAVASPPLLPASERGAFYQRLLDRVKALPGVTEVGVGSEMLVSSVSQQPVVAEDAGERGSVLLAFRRDEVGPGFLEALRVPLVRGRFFTEADSTGPARVVVVNGAMAEQLWSGRDPIGRRFTIGVPAADATWFTVIGVAGDMRRQGLEQAPVPQMFEVHAQNPSRRAVLLVRTPLDDPLRLVGPLRDAVRGVDVQAAVYGATTVRGAIDARLSSRRLQLGVLSMFAVVAILLAAAGIYSVMRHSVTSRAHEIAIRLAIGGAPRDIRRMVLAEGLWLGGAGLGVGLALSLVLGRFVTSVLYGVSSADVATFATVASVLAVATLVASDAPARAAARIDPGRVLRP